MSERGEAEEDALRVAIFNNQMTLLWQQIQYVPVVEAGSIAAWYLVRSEAALAVGVLLGSSVMLSLLLLIIRRHAQILEGQTTVIRQRLLSEAGGTPHLFGRPLRGHVLARLVPFTLICANTALALVTTGLAWLPRAPAGGQLSRLGAAVLCALLLALLAFLCARFRFYVFEP